MEVTYRYMKALEIRLESIQGKLSSMSYTHMSWPRTICVVSWPRRTCAMAMTHVRPGQDNNDSSMVHHLSFVIHHPSFIIHHPSSIIYHPPSIIHHQSFLIYHLSSIINQQVPCRESAYLETKLTRPRPRTTSVQVRRPCRL